MNGRVCQRKNRSRTLGVFSAFAPAPAGTLSETVRRMSSMTSSPTSRARKSWITAHW